MATTEERVDRLEGVVERLEAKFDAMDARFDTLDARFDAMDAKIDANHAAAMKIIDVIDAKLSGATRSLEAIAKCVGANPNF